MNRSPVRVRVSAQFSDILFMFFAVIAQLVEHWLPKPRVASSSLVYRSKCKVLKIRTIQAKAVSFNCLFILFSALRIGLLMDIRGH